MQKPSLELYRIGVVVKSRREEQYIPHQCRLDMGLDGQQYIALLSFIRFLQANEIENTSIPHGRMDQSSIPITETLK